MKAYRIAMLCIISCLYVSAAESSGNINFTDYTYELGKYSVDDYKKYSAYKEIIVKAQEKNKNDPRCWLIYCRISRM